MLSIAPPSEFSENNFIEKEVKNENSRVISLDIVRIHLKNYVHDLCIRAAKIVTTVHRDVEWAESSMIRSPAPEVIKQKS